MIEKSTDPDVTYEAFVQQCHRTANRLEQITASEKREQGYSRPSKTSQIRTARGHTPSSKEGASSKPKISFEERRRRMKEGLCVICGYEGHFAKECPDKEEKPAKEIKIAGVDGASSDDESGKVRA
jgi:hypothetical protein